MICWVFSQSMFSMHSKRSKQNQVHCTECWRTLTQFFVDLLLFNVNFWGNIMVHIIEIHYYLCTFSSQQSFCLIQPFCLVSNSGWIIWEFNAKHRLPLVWTIVFYKRKIFLRHVMNSSRQEFLHNIWKI